MFDVLKPISPPGHSYVSWSIHDVYAQILSCPSAEDSTEYLLIESFSPTVLVSGATESYYVSTLLYFRSSNEK
jgi:hypothetical protein